MLDDMAILHATTTTPLTDEELVVVGGGGAFPLGHLEAAAKAGYIVGSAIAANTGIDEWLGDKLLQVLPPWPSRWSF